MTPLNIVFVHSLAVFARLRRENAQFNEFYGGRKQDDEILFLFLSMEF